eukprot:2463386-Prymnesium_polylepis.1
MARNDAHRKASRVRPRVALEVVDACCGDHARAHQVIVDVRLPRHYPKWKTASCERQTGLSAVAAVKRKRRVGHRQTLADDEAVTTAQQLWHVA